MCPHRIGNDTICAACVTAAQFDKTLLKHANEIASIDECLPKNSLSIIQKTKELCRVLNVEYKDSMCGNVFNMYLECAHNEDVERKKIELEKRFPT